MTNTCARNFRRLWLHTWMQHSKKPFAYNTLIHTTCLSQHLTHSTSDGLLPPTHMFNCICQADITPPPSKRSSPLGAVAFWLVCSGLCSSLRAAPMELLPAPESRRHAWNGRTCCWRKQQQQKRKIRPRDSRSARWQTSVSLKLWLLTQDVSHRCADPQTALLTQDDCSYTSFITYGIIQWGHQRIQDIKPTKKKHQKDMRLHCYKADKTDMGWFWVKMIT